MSDDTRLLMERLARLERQARWWKLLTFVAIFAALGGTAATTAQQTAVTVTGTKFVLQESGDKPRAVLEMRGVQPTLSFFDVKGRELLQLAVLDNGRPSIKWLDRFGRAHEVLAGPGVRPLTTP
jgi:hypothetical protein